MNLKWHRRNGLVSARRVTALAIVLVAGGALACAQSSPRLGEWRLSDGVISTKDFKLAFGSASSEALTLLGEPPSGEPWPFHFSFHYAGFLSLDYSDSTERLTGVRIYFEKGLDGEGVAAKVSIDIKTVEVFGIRVDDSSTWAVIEKQARERGVIILRNSVEKEKIGLSDGIYVTWFNCEKDQGGDLHSMEYFKLPD